MKRLMLASFSLLMVSAVVIPAAKADEVQNTAQNTTESTTTFQDTISYQTNPAEVVNLARNGYFIDEGVPSFARLQSDYLNGNLSAEDVIQAAIAQGRVSQDTIDDYGYVQAVRLQLQDLGDHNR